MATDPTLDSAAGVPATRPALHWWLPLLTLAAGLGLTLLAWWLVDREVQAGEQQRFERITDRVLNAAGGRFSAAVQAVHGGRALLAASEDVTREDWAAYVEGTQPYFHEGVVGLGYVERIRRGEIEALEARLRREGTAGFVVERTGDREWVYAVTRIEPIARNAGALGLDVGSGVTRKTAADDAMRLNEPVLSRRIAVIEGAGEIPGFLLFLPVYQRGAPAATPDEREAALTGWVYASLRIDELTSGLVELTGGQVDFAIKEDGPADEPLLFASGSGAPALGLRVPPREATLNLHGRQWTFHFTARPEFNDFTQRTLPSVVLAAGAVLSVLGSLLVLALVNARRRALVLADSMTIDLSEANHRLEHAVEQARRSADEATKANQAKSQFLALMSHEIRTPMNGVLGMTGLLLETPLAPDQRDAVETIRSSGDALLALLGDILDFSKIESGHLELEQAPFDLRATVDAAVAVFGQRAAERRLELVCDVASDVPARVSGDGGRLRQVVVNLLSNAIKFTEAGEVVVSVRRAREPEGALAFTVRDTGAGIAPEVQERIFSPFTQADLSTTRKHGGTGLGLAISRRLVEMMGGTIWVESEPGAGASFHFTAVLPVVAGSGIADARSRPTLDGRRLMVVDDNESSRRVIAGMARGWGMNVDAVANGAHALDLLSGSRRVDVMAIDLDMPGIDGDGLARAIRAERLGGTPPMVLLAPVGRQPQGTSFAAIVTKPVKPGPFADALTRAIAGRELALPTPTPAAPEPAPSPVVTGGGYRILLAEDNAVNQRVAVAILKALGCEADVVANGAEALDALAHVEYDLVLLDVQMPEIDGLEVARRVSRRYSGAINRPWLVAFTANAVEGDREACLAAGMDDYLTKPARRAEIEAMLERFRAARSKSA